MIESINFNWADPTERVAGGSNEHEIVFGKKREIKFRNVRESQREIANVAERVVDLNPLNPELNPICYLLALLAHHFLYVSRIRVKSLTIRLLMSYIYIWNTYS